MGSRTNPQKQTTFTLKPRPPFRLDLTVWVLRRLPINRIDRWENNTYSRVFVISGQPVPVSVSQQGPVDSPVLHVTARTSSQHQPTIEALLNRILGLNIDLNDFYHRIGPDEHLGPLIRRFVGFKPPRLPTIFETLVNGISCQQLSLNVGISLLNRLTETFGRATDHQHAFPLCEDLANASIHSLKDLGYSGRKAQYIISIAREISENRLDLERLQSLDDQAAMHHLLAIRGVGPWTAEYVMLRGLGRVNVIPADDVGIQNKIQQWLGLPARPDSRTVRRRLERYAPWTGLVYFYLLLDYMAARDWLLPTSSGGSHSSPTEG